VGILAAKSEEAYVGLLAALYAGAAAVPLGPEVPAERNRAIAAAAGVDALVVDEAGGGQLPVLRSGLAAGAVVLSGPDRDAPGARPFAPPPGRSAGDLAYVMFTSGSTGAPKGVPITHRNVTAFLAASRPRYDFGPDDAFSQVYELTFDLAMFDIFMAWGSGACLYPLTRLQALHPVRFVEGLGLTVWHTTPSLVDAVRGRGAAALPAGSMPGLRHTIWCGEPLRVETASCWREAAPNAVLDNIYGPTELTIACTAYRWRVPGGTSWTAGETVPIGLPNPGMEYRILGDDGVGELCMTGPQMFPGYLDPANDDGRFITLEGRRWYRTGDRVRLVNGVGLVHLGRTDDQVKVQGYRIELGEVEHAVREAAGVPAAAAFAMGTFLVAFVAAGAELDVAGVVVRMSELLPAYMLPRHLWALPELPLNRSGKVDRSALREEAARRLRGQE
jgi:amino acid adenylation domain-containing protein